MVDKLSIEELERFETTTCIYGPGCIIDNGACGAIICYYCTLAC